ncbi:MAG: hypothetical protein WAW41_20955, partial [Methylobacter sp.]
AIFCFMASCGIRTSRVAVGTALSCPRGKWGIGHGLSVMPNLLAWAAALYTVPSQCSCDNFMEKYAMHAVQVRELKNNPSQALRKAEQEMVVVMNRDRPSALLLHFDETMLQKTGFP